MRPSEFKPRGQKRVLGKLGATSAGRRYSGIAKLQLIKSAIMRDALALAIQKGAPGEVIEAIKKDILLTDSKLRRVHDVESKFMRYQILASLGRPRLARALASIYSQVAQSKISDNLSLQNQLSKIALTRVVAFQAYGSVRLTGKTAAERNEERKKILRRLHEEVSNEN
ncbi:MAG TPA: hypothetical protein HA222_02120 [Candidatus Diapherotrites archaeon]|uniref:Uncharacterized protein n=1 Tax=Candidatus Iainarchaeum sp. TaxID=3101447 RepID=A0A7J4KRT8_9ARCH|nr:hypothetical protein [Candidatus Diapherotrites archaeon]HIH32741.1 hypothetical protein [Candidatus Diapherotrites archaeon]